MVNRLQKYLAGLIVAALTLALLSLPFAHRTSASAVTPEMSEFLAMGGTLKDICGDIEGMLDGGCESCRVIAGTDLAPHLAVAHPAFVAKQVRRVQDTFANTRDPADGLFPPVRAPPRA